MDTIEEKALRIYPDDTNPTLEPNATYRRACERSAYIKACEEYESLPKIHGWVARDMDGCLMMTHVKPHRGNDWWLIDSDSKEAFDLPKELFPEITWDSDPVEVELLIRRV